MLIIYFQVFFDTRWLILLKFSLYYTYALPWQPRSHPTCSETGGFVSSLINENKPPCLWFAKTTQLILAELGFELELSG